MDKATMTLVDKSPAGSIPIGYINGVEVVNAYISDIPFDAVYLNENKIWEFSSTPKSYLNKIVFDPSIKSLEFVEV